MHSDMCWFMRDLNHTSISPAVFPISFVALLHKLHFKWYITFIVRYVILERSSHVIFFGHKIESHLFTYNSHIFGTLVWTFKNPIFLIQLFEWKAAPASLLRIFLACRSAKTILKSWNISLRWFESISNILY